MTQNICCADLELHLKMGLVIYFSPTRLYMLKVDNHTGQTIKYCPWCGQKLPEDLDDLRANIVFDQLKLKSFDDPNLPEEFKTDKWWKKRGL